VSTGRDHAHADPDARGSRRGRTGRRLAITLGLVVAYMGAEVIGGFLANSLALLADAGHMLSDAGALALALVAIRVAERPATARHTYGYHRAEILAALANGATLVAIAIVIFVEAYERMRNPPEVAGGLMMGVAVGGLLINGAGLWILHSGRDESLNVRGAWLHVLTDALGSVQAIVAGALILAFGWNWIDPVASVLIGLLVIYSAWSILGQSVAVLMERAPGHLDVDSVRAALLELPHVSNVHDLHVWTITSGFVALSVHVTCRDPAERDTALHAARQVLADRFNIRHTTIQVDRDPECRGGAH
jgi:cobalt-zinc-cadmium efflux system protein